MRLVQKVNKVPEERLQCFDGDQASSSKLTHFLEPFQEHIEALSDPHQLHIEFDFPVEPTQRRRDLFVGDLLGLTVLLFWPQEVVSL